MLSTVDRMQVFGDLADGVAATGTTAATATILPSDHCCITTATDGSAEGVIMKAGEPLDHRTVCNASTVGINVYPPTGSAFNGATANAPFNLPPKRALLAVFLTAAKITAVAA